MILKAQTPRAARRVEPSRPATGTRIGASAMRYWATRTGAAGAAALLGGALMLPAAGTFGSAQAVPLPLEPDDPAVARQWVNPLLRPGESDDQVSLELTETQPATITPGQPVTVTLRLHNHTEQTVSGLQLQPQRADPATSTSQARQLLGYEAGAYAWFGGEEILSDELAPGESRKFQLELPTDPGAAGTLSISSPGLYPVLISLSGTLSDDGYTQFSTERFLLNATAENDADAAADPDPAAPGAADPAATPTSPLTMIYPITADSDILPGETGDSPGDTPLLLGSEQLAAELSPGGRLDQLLQQYRGAVAAEGGQELRDASCLAVDPELLDTVDRMSRGYAVNDSRQIEQPQSRRLRDSWTQPDDPDPATPGTGQDEAARWLAELEETTADSCVVALPWSNADLDAVHATGNQWLMRETLERGSATINRILNVDPVSNVVIPGSGYVSPATAPALGWADRSEAADQTPQSVATDQLEAAWEQQAAAVTSPAETTGATGESETDTLEDTTPPDAGTTDLPQPPETTVNVLVADNTVWGSTQVDRFAELTPGITAVTYQDSLAATLAATGENPETVGYSNPDTRFDYRIDSAAARDRTAAAMVVLAAAEIRNSAAPGIAETEPLMVMPSANFSAGAAAALLDAARQLLADETMTPLSLVDFLSPTPEQQAQLATAQPSSGAAATAFGAPFDDPTVFSDAEILRTAQQANYIDDLTRIMTNDPAIALTRYQFTAPLRRDLLVALSGAGRRSLGTFTEDVSRTDQRLTENRQTLQSLRSSVSLIPPGNVYTRASESSPLLIVAENRLPLPAQAKIIYSGPPGAELNVPDDIRIPAMGSITLQMTADLPEDRERTDLVLRLATMDGAAISDPVEISVQTRAGLVGTSSAIIALVAALVLALIFRVGSHRKRRAARRRDADAATTEPTTRDQRSSTRASRGAPRRGAGHADENSGSPKPPGQA